MPTCDELQGQLTTALRQRVELDGTIIGDRGDLSALEKEGSLADPKLIAAAKAQLAADQAAVPPLDQQIALLTSQLRDAGCFIQPQQILDIQFTNPPHPLDVDALLAQAIAFGQQDASAIKGGKFPSR